MPRRNRISQWESNPFPYSSDNKRYHTLSWHYKNLYGKKCAKIPLNAGFTCPNRDGTKATGGCTFCSASGSGDTILGFTDTLQKQYAENLARARKKWPDCAGIAYFQAYSNTYAPLEKLKEIYTPFLEDDDVLEVSIATRADCLSQEAIDWLASWNKTVWIELGLQTVHEQTAQAIRRFHTTEEVAEKTAACKKAGLKTCIHLMNGLPGETREMMVESARQTGAMHPDAVKIHMLHILKNTQMARDYEKQPFWLPDEAEYVQTVCDQLEVLPADIIIERLTGDGVQSDLIAPLWTTKKTVTVNEIDKELLRRNSWQGKKADLAS